MEPRDIITLGLHSLGEYKAEQPKKVLAGHKDFLAQLPFIVNRRPEQWTEAMFEGFWRKLLDEGCSLLCIDHLSIVQGKLFVFELNLCSL